MNILISGVAGLIGSWLAKGFLQQGHRVIGIDNMSGGLWSNLPSQPNPLFLFFQTDLTNYSVTEEILMSQRPEIIYHLSSCPREGSSEFQPVKITASNIMAAVTLLELGIKSGMKRFVFTSCLDEESRLVTSNGLKRYNEIFIGDRILSINTGTGFVENDTVEEIYLYPYKGEMIYFNGRSINCLVTPNHRILHTSSYKNYSSDHLLYTQACDLLPEQKTAQSSVRIPKGIWRGRKEPNDFFDIPARGDSKNRFSKMHAFDLFYLTGLFIADGVANKGVSLSLNKSGFSRLERMNIRDSRGKFTRSLTTGEKKYSLNHSYRIRFCVPRNDKARPKLESILNKYNISWVEDKQCGWVWFSHKWLHDFFKLCGDSALEKHIPGNLLDYDTEYLHYLWEGLIDGDGSWTDKKASSGALSTSSYQLVLDCINLGHKINKRVTFSRRKQQEVKFPDGRNIISKEAFWVFFGNSSGIYKKHICAQNNYDGIVWCIKTRNGNFLMERNGRTIFTGNSMSVYGKQDPPFSEKLPRSPVDPYGANKAATEQIIEQMAETHGFEYVIFRPHNVFAAGENIRDPYRGVMSIFMNRIMRKDPIYLYGENHVRAFSYIEDCLPALMKASDSKKVNGEIINIGGIEPTSIRELAEVIISCFPEYPRPEIIQLPPRPHEVARAWCTVDRSVKLLDYKENIGWKEGITRMSTWAKKLGKQEWQIDDLPLLNSKAPAPWLDLQRNK